MKKFRYFPDSMYKPENMEHSDVYDIVLYDHSNSATHQNVCSKAATEHLFSLMPEYVFDYSVVFSHRIPEGKWTQYF